MLIPLLILCTYTGIELHLAGHGTNHETWHHWAVFHVVISLLFFIVVVFHVTTHRNWYKGLFRKGIGKKSKVTLGLSVIFVAVVVTGIVLLHTEGANSAIGLWHYSIGILASALSTGHLLKRIPALRKSLQRKSACVKDSRRQKTKPAKT